MHSVKRNMCYEIELFKALYKQKSVFEQEF